MFKYKKSVNSNSLPSIYNGISNRQKELIFVSPTINVSMLFLDSNKQLSGIYPWVWFYQIWFFFILSICTLMSHLNKLKLTLCVWMKVWFFFFLFFLFLLYFTLQNCIGFNIHWPESTTGVHAIPTWTPLPPPSP